MQHGEILLTAGILLSFSSIDAQAALIDRGGGLLYDDVLDVTWLQDANYAKTSGYNADGKMDWNTAIVWAGSLVYHDSVRNVDYSDWRLAINTPVNGSLYNVNWSPDGSTDYGYNITTPHSEMSYMYYVNLGLKGYVSSAGTVQPDYGIFGNGDVGGQNNVGPVINLQSEAYWSGTEYATVPSNAWNFYFNYGFQSYITKDTQFFTWAVRNGDVSSIPVPGAIWLFGSGLAVLLSSKRRSDAG